MKRSDFLKISALSSVGVFSTIPQVFSRTASPDRHVIRISTDDEEVFGPWLARLVVSSLVSALAAKVVDKWTGSCACNGGACDAGTAKSSAYSNPQGIYGYSHVDRRFLTQYIDDDNMEFTNVSAPFLNNSNAHFMNVEGPFLAGMCWAAEDVSRAYSRQTAQQLFIPRSEISNGGYRFDINSCEPTSFRTDSGSTDIYYAPNRKNDGGVVRVTAKNTSGSAIWARDYEMEFG